MRLDDVLADFMKNSGQGSGVPIHLGAAPAREPSVAERRALLDMLRSTVASARQVVWMWLAAIIATFVLAAGFAIYHRDNITFVSTMILGGSGVLALLLQQVRSVHARMVSSEALLALLPNLPPAEWAKMAKAILEEVLKAPAARSSAAAAPGRQDTKTPDR